MYLPILVAVLGMAPVTLQADTVIPVERGARLDVDNFRGEVVVDVWSRSAVRVRADLSRDQRVEVVRSGSVVRVRPATRRGGPQEADLEITVPEWLHLRVEGNQVDVSVRGTKAEITVETVGGDIEVEGGAGLVNVRSIQGELEIRGARGRIEAVSVNEEITLEDVDGDLYVETTNGDVTMRGIRSSGTRATTVNGDIVYEGTIRDNGRYVFSTHNGDVAVSVPPEANTTVSVSTYHGEFESDFPVRLTGTGRDRQFTFTLGSGSARLELESFNGEIRLFRP
ncbi:MAG: DUF4097 family beta strand repeat protein [Gemmatimonadetes bacterium]|nr:DUF4097 family beta strand repeat protein [Gemmatimonadota bacterium]NIQ58606.1 DUF4097 family beta strand repeat protein [Gemmatimonadota bacterium]NIU78796.1 DUF4097 family beta strand repeat protein [Gammaproteobacteria bacterium]NIX47608.1 DUF4097 family beta strand repeat protein [Gemmatimonadota bacterium]NIY11968.1 DUF4097 family beta strand repeat protein [Gemmatimonadota bacterium]